MRWDDNTTIAVAITSATGKTYDLAADFSNAKNPNGTWSYGWLAAGPAPDAATFKPYVKCETEKYDRHRRAEQSGLGPLGRRPGRYALLPEGPAPRA